MIQFSEKVFVQIGNNLKLADQEKPRKTQVEALWQKK